MRAFFIGEVMAALGSVVVELSANIARFQSDMGKAAAIAEQRAKEIDKYIGIIKTGLSGVGLGFAFGATFDTIKSKIEGVIATAAGLQQLSERTGSAVGSLSGLVAVAKLSGTGTDDLAGGLQKLSKAMIDAENGGKKTGETFKAIGISTNDLKNKRPDEVFQLVAKRLNEYQDGAEKTVAAQNLLGKAGANLLPVMHDLAEVGDLQVKVTIEQARAADEYEKNLVRLQVISDAIFKTFGLELIPVLDTFVKTLIESANASDGMKREVDSLAGDGTIRSWTEHAAQSLAVLVDAFDDVGRAIQRTTAIAGAMSELGKSLKGGGITYEGMIRAFKGDTSKDDPGVKIGDDLRATIAAIDSKEHFSDRLKKNIQRMHFGMGAGPGRGSYRDPRRVDPESEWDTLGQKKPIDLSGTGNANAYKGPSDDPTRKILEGQLKAQEDFITSEKAQLQSREQMLDFYQGLEYSTLRESEMQKQDLIAGNLKQTEAAYDKEAAAIKAYIAQASKQTDRADGQNKLADVARKRAAAETQASTQMIDSQLKLESVKARFNLATQEQIRLDALVNQGAQFQIDMMGKNSLEVMKATEARRIQLQLDERIRLLRKDDPTVDTSAAVAAAAIQTAQAQSLITEAYNKQRDAIFGAGEAVRKYHEDAMNTGAQVENAMTNAFKGMEDALVTFVTTGKLNFKSLADGIVADITRIIIKQQMASLLGGSGSGGGGAGGILSGLLGGLLGGGFGGATAAFSQTAIGGSGFGSGLAYGNADLGGFFADGGDPPLNRPSVVGENGPELFVPKSAGTIIPNSAFGGGSGAGNTTVVHNNFTIQGTTDRRSQAQIAAAAASGAQRALARNS